LLVYRQRARAPQAQAIVFLDDSGRVVKTVSRPGISQGASVSPDGKTVAALCDDPELNVCLVYQDGTLTRISEGPINCCPVWSPDGSSMVYGTHRGARRFSLVLKDLKAQKPERVLMESDSSVEPTSWAPSLKELLVERTNPRNHLELGILRLADQKYRNFLSANVNVNVTAGRFSLDGKWVAYQSDDSGRDEVYIASYPDQRQKYTVSRAGGHAPRWTNNGRELYFLDSSDMIQRVRIETSGADLRIGSPQPVFRPSTLAPPYDYQSFDVTAKEPVFVINANASKNDSEYILVTSWK
jgi:eukaryotic-like serine/threonine-protein kinase